MAVWKIEHNKYKTWIDNTENKGVSFTKDLRRIKIQLKSKSSLPAFQNKNKNYKYKDYLYRNKTWVLCNTYWEKKYKTEKLIFFSNKTKAQKELKQNWITLRMLPYFRNASSHNYILQGKKLKKISIFYISNITRSFIMNKNSFHYNFRTTDKLFI